MVRNAKNIIYGVVCSIVIWGCAVTPKPVDHSPHHIFKKADNDVVIAVLPFKNSTADKNVAEMVRRSIYCQLSVRPYRDIELHRVDKILESLNLTDPLSLNNQMIRKLGRLLKCDALVTGEVTADNRLFLGVYSQTAVEATISIRNTHTGRIVWADQYVSRFHEGGVPWSLIEIPLLSIRSTWNLRNRIKIRVVDDLARHLVERIPTEPDLPKYTKNNSKVLSN